ncbi:MAG: hypothetical protein QF689_00340 [Candidatus Latescibacteria bacterium]|jgi:hypothetical protein|nr:hypothetical protein [Gemmatimonadaceae bacterium]MDP6015540.1 hypothetical protein [Candidatus Latescibacterota bacterium]MDP7447007.1 hypothetical protein [Candidatus Latescibacterota bacterium]HJP33182.1 hypothetical protein [Candidatus Latescibacterota bacterium]|tara:strand:- start:123 stop:302 length:180 start_codon:yes stop_codon:yes gene_type:complete
MTQPQKKPLVCDTCGRQSEHLRRDVVDDGYNALSKPAMWNCDECYDEKRRRRQGLSTGQ